MKSAFLAITLSGFLALALPTGNKAALPADSSLALRVGTLYGTSSNELGLCRAVTIIFARGTIEPGYTLEVPPSLFG